MALKMISSSPQLFLYWLCASFLILHSLEILHVCGSVTEPGESAMGNETDFQSLLAFKDGITSDPFGALASWNHTVHFCQWFGVTCGRRHRQRVTKLDLDHQDLRGLLPPHIGNLSFLRELWLRNNSLGSKIPPEIGRLQRLQKMSLLNNSIGGDIPVNISRCSNLVILDLSRNNLEGTIPVELGMLSRLEELYFGRNFNIAGVIPSNLANMSSLRYFFAPNNMIDGSIPNEMSLLKNLEIFAVSYNKLVGIIPLSIWNISSMEYFDVANNQLGGMIPSELGGIIFPRLSKFHISNNSFTGSIPVSISNASYLEELQMNSNKLTGGVPPMDKLTKLRNLYLHYNNLGSAGKFDDLRFLSLISSAINLDTIVLSYNNFGGVLPGMTGNLSSKSLRILYFPFNEVSGIIPPSFGNLTSLWKLIMGNNKLTGNIPSTIGNLNKLQMLNLRYNDFNGTIQTSFGNLSILLYLYMDGNNFHGTIPSALGKCTKLVEFFIHSNNLEGILPREIFTFSSLLSLDLGSNRFTGDLPTEVGTLVNLVQFDISDNMLSGKIPSTLARCVQLLLLYMGLNNFSGIFPSSIGSLRGLQVLDASHNNFSGILPSSLSSLRALEVLDLSYNNFSGTVPKYLEVFPFLQSLNLSFNDFDGALPDKGIFKNATGLNVEGNIKLCGGFPKLHLPKCNSKPSEKKLRIKLIIGLSFGVTVVAAMFLLFLYLCWSKKPRTLPSIHSPWNSLLKLSYQNLYEATDGFSDTNLIGGGSFGSVYKGLLHQDQRIVAVKVLNLQHQGASRSFQAECEALRTIRHRNLLKVLTACSSIDHQGNDFKAIVYEFMPNGSLDDVLHLHETQEEMQGDGRNLNLSQRLDVSIDVASAVEYLHHRCEEAIVHCDLKPSNILLDNDMVAHVGDFGLAKLIQEGTSIQSSDNQSSTIGLRGSVGYVAPEYGMGNEVSTFGDVYSYGIIVLEMFTGKRPTDHHLFNGCLNLRDHVEMNLPDNVETVADPRLLLFDENGETHDQDSIVGSERIKECLVSLLRVGIACAQELPRDRMTINDAIIQLRTIKKSFLRTGIIHVNRSTSHATPSQVQQ